jgi:hypothetical protein
MLPSSFSTFALIAASILMSSGQPRKLSGFAGKFLRRVEAEFAAAGDFARRVVHFGFGVHTLMTHIGVSKLRIPRRAGEGDHVADV